MKSRFKKYSSYFKSLLSKRHLSDKNSSINLVCYNPSYLFKDLTRRFLDSFDNITLTDLPTANADSYIWLRTQELHQLHSFIYRNKSTFTTGQHKALYASNLFYLKKMDINRIIKKSTVIHHGVCPDPIFQFSAKELTTFLKEVPKVVGVCPFDKCYRQFSNIASQENFDFVPIGFDDIIFDKKFIKRETKDAHKKLNIGFIGKAYGTADNSMLYKSKLATPLGYIKGGDRLINTALRLKALGINFKLTLLGNNWDNFVKSLNEYNIEVDYYTRDKSISYVDYPSIYKNLDVLFIPTRGESGPVTTMEALSMGVPIVSSSSSGLASYLNQLDKQWTTLVPADEKWGTFDYESAVLKIKHIYDSTVTFEDRLNMRSVVNKYTTNNWVNEIVHTFKKEK